MSSIVVAGDVSGAISIAAPSAAGSGVLTLPTGTDTLVGKATTDTLTNKSIAATQLTGTIAASALPAGSVLQVVSSNYSTQVTNATNTYVDTGLTASITPRSTSSKILVIVSQNGMYKTAGNSQNSATPLTGGSSSTNYLDSPATTSATTYKTQIASSFNTSAVSCQQDGQTSTITLMEIAG